jgi:uncharacterized membrane protein
MAGTGQSDPNEQHNGHLTDVVQRNIDALLNARQRAEKQKSLADHLADSMTAVSGSMLFVYLHIAWFGLWILWNLGLIGLSPFDPFPFGLLTMIVSLEAIFLSTFVLISQNRQAKVDDRRADLDVQIDLLAEHEITRILQLVDAIARSLNVPVPAKKDLVELQEDVEPDALLEELEKRDSPR